MKYCSCGQNCFMFRHIAGRSVGVYLCQPDFSHKILLRVNIYEEVNAETRNDRLDCGPLWGQFESRSRNFFLLSLALQTCPV